MTAVWLAQVAHHARALGPAPDAIDAVCAVPDPPALLAARLALRDPAAPFVVAALVEAYEARERLCDDAVADAERAAETRAAAARLRAALGNSIAVPVMRWIGERIAMVDRIAIARTVPR